MGVAVLLESEPELSIPSGFPKTDSKGFLATLFGPRVEVLEQGLGVDLAPFGHVATFADEEMIREDYGHEADAVIAEANRESELAWQTPDAFIASLPQLAERLEREGRKLPPAVHDLVDPGGHRLAYYQSGNFYSDVVGCLAAIRWAKEHGARRVRFFAY
jgi:hypothetical protein